MPETKSRPQMTLTLPPQMREALDQVKADTGRDLSEIIREAVQEWLDRRKRGRQ